MHPSPPMCFSSGSVLVLLALALAGIQLDLSLKFAPGSPVRAGVLGVGWLVRPAPLARDVF